MTQVEINGEPASTEALHRAATWNYGHFTSMQVRNRAVAGLDLHLRRLTEGSATLFPDAAPPLDATVRTLIGHALGPRPDASVRVTVLPNPSTPARTDIMVSVSDPVPDDPRPPLRVRAIRYERELPHLKHVATMGLSYHYSQARRAGYDDVLFTGPDGLVREGSVWNIAFWTGTQVVWPEAPMLPGITMQLLRRGLNTLGIPQTTRPLTIAALTGMKSAAATNSHCPAQPIAAIDDFTPAPDNDLTARLRAAWQLADWQPLDRQP